MTNFTKKSFSVAVGSKDYRDGYERIFGRKDAIPLAARILRLMADLTPKERALVEQMNARTDRAAEIEDMANDAMRRAKASYEKTKRLPRNPIIDALLGKSAKAK